MKLMNCTTCGSKELVEEDGVVVCTYCQSRYQPGTGDAAPVPPMSSERDKTEFDVILEGVGRDKIAVLKGVRMLTGFGLKDAMKLVESVPQPVLRNVSKEAAERAKGHLEAAGCVVSIR
jgi:large subunit ribosomal protein L7/L12